MKILILGVNGFIGNSLVRAILERTSWQVVGMDLSDDKLEHSLGHHRFRFEGGDITTHRAWVDSQVAACDLVLPLVAIATPMDYVRQPLRVFELTFEENLRIVRQCVSLGKRLIFPSTSEVYGMCEDEEFLEDTSPLVLGPIHKQRWIYACSKQLLDRMIWAYGEAGQLEFTLVRPFNWIGPRLDDLQAAREGSSRVVTQFISNLLEGSPIRLVDGGTQRRCFTYIDDGIDCLLRIIANRTGLASGEIFNVGNPANECSMRQLAEKLLGLFRKHPRCSGRRTFSPIIATSADEFYGAGYQDILTRTPSVAKARQLLGWQPQVGLDEALQRTLHAHLETWPSIEPALDREPIPAPSAGQRR